MLLGLLIRARARRAKTCLSYCRHTIASDCAVRRSPASFSFGRPRCEPPPLPPPPPFREVPPIELPPPTPTPGPFTVPAAPQPALLRPMTVGEFAACFKPTCGTHEVLLIHPRTGCPVKVCFT